MVSETDRRPVERDIDCVLLTDADGTIRWASPSATTVLQCDHEAIRDTERVQSLLGPDAPDPRHAGTDPIGQTVRRADAPDLSVTVESASATGVTIYRCRPHAAGQLALDGVLSRVDDAVVAFDTDFRYTYVNAAAETLLGHDIESLLGELVWDVFPDAEGTRLHEMLERAMRTQESATMEWYWEPTGQSLDVRCFPSPTGVSLYFRDVTERREREDALRRERDLVEQLLRVSPMGIAVHAPDGRFVRLNERAEAIIGVPSEVLVGEALNEPVWAATDLDGDPFPDEAFPLNVVFRTGEPTFGTEMSVRRSDGSRLALSVSAAPLVDDAGDIERVVVAFEDITERTQYERDLRESEQQFRAVFDGTLDALVLADDDGTYLEVNDAACDLYGLDADELVGRNVADFASPAYDVGAAWDAFLDSGTLRGEFPLVRPDGEVRTVDFAATADIAPGLHLSALRDTTERTQDERQLAVQRDELSRLNHINELIRNVNRTVVGATDRDSIQQAVCTELESERYPVVIAASLTAGDEMHVDHAAGLSADLLATLRAGEPTSLEAAMLRASTENTLTVLSDLRTDDAYAESLTSLATTYDIAAFANIPIAYDGVVCGVLTVGASDGTAFTDREQSVLLELGQLLGTAIDAIRTKKLLYGSAYQELKLAASARDAPLVEFHDRLGTGLTFDSVVPLDTGRYLVYLVADTTQSAVDAAADGIAGIETVRVVESDHRPLVELRVGEATAVSALLDAGGWVRSGTMTGGVGEFVVDVPLDTDVRAYLDRVEQRGIDLGLLAKREVERTTPAVWDDSSDQLTARQRAVLAAAYRSGYFEWPRRQTTGEELADALDISSSTLHQHLRVASAKVLGQYVAANPDDPT